MTEHSKPAAEALAALLARVRGATAQDRDLDVDLMVSLGGMRDVFGDRLLFDRGNDGYWTTSEHDDRNAPLPSPTASLDAALALVQRVMAPNLLGIEGTWEPRCPEAWPAWTIRWYPPPVNIDGRSWWAQVGSAPTPALALNATLLMVLLEIAEAEGRS